MFKKCMTWVWIVGRRRVRLRIGEGNGVFRGYGPFSSVDSQGLPLKVSNLDLLNLRSWK